MSGQDKQTTKLTKADRFWIGFHVMVLFSAFVFFLIALYLHLCEKCKEPPEITKPSTTVEAPENLQLTIINNDTSGSDRCRRLSFAFPVMFTIEAQAEHWKKEEQKWNECPQNEPDKIEHSDSVCPNQDLFTPLLEELLEGLAPFANACKPISLKTVGFASSSSATETSGLKKLLEDKKCWQRADNKDPKQQQSNAFNLCMAELRAENVSNMLSKIINENKWQDFFEVTTREWDNFDEMAEHRDRHYNDESCHGHGLPDDERGLPDKCDLPYDECELKLKLKHTAAICGSLNRRVEIHIN